MYAHSFTHICIQGHIHTKSSFQHRGGSKPGYMNNEMEKLPRDVLPDSCGCCAVTLPWKCHLLNSQILDNKESLVTDLSMYL